jgi:hypothetical protein
MYGSFLIYILCRHFDKFPLAALRRLAAMFGTALIPLCYITMRNLGHSRPAATLAAGLLIFGIDLGMKYVYFCHKTYICLV